LVMTWAESRKLYGQDKYHSLSRFVREIPASLLREVRLRNTVSRPVLATRGMQGGPIPGTPEQPLQLGQRVRHPRFGEGIVLNCEGVGHHTRVQVNFDEGAKWLVLAYAPLE